ncbi:MAG: Fur family transcriptional regulator [Actinobacteria bacterium]|nr:Fur family transcriptional regulator [Actinomycetota bacterium]
MHPKQIDVHDTADERLRRDGQRYTANRRVLIDALSTADRPVTVLELIEVAPGMAQSSAYRNLSVLEDAGVVRRLVTADDTSRYELAEDLTGHHHHLICESCGSVIDIDVPDELEEDVTSFSSAVAESHGFRIEHHRLDLIGVCPSCSNSAH